MPGKVEGFGLPGRVTLGPPGREPAPPAPAPPGLVEGRVAGRVEGDGLEAGREEADGFDAGRVCGRWTFEPVAGLRRAELLLP